MFSSYVCGNINHIFSIARKASLCLALRAVFSFQPNTTLHMIRKQKKINLLKPSIIIYHQDYNTKQRLEESFQLIIIIYNLKELIETSSRLAPRGHCQPIKIQFIKNNVLFFCGIILSPAAKTAR